MIVYCQKSKEHVESASAITKHTFVNIKTLENLKIFTQQQFIKLVSVL